MTFNFIPPGLYSFLVRIAEENQLSVKEVETMFMRKTAEDLGFECDHNAIGYSKTTKKPYCKRCWVRLDMEAKATYFKGKLIKANEYSAIETFVDRFYKERMNREVELSTRESKFEHEN